MRINALCLGLSCLFFSLSFAANTVAAQCEPWTVDTKHRIFVLSDISNEPDDTMSFVRLLTHSDLYDIKGMVAVTSYWLPNGTRPDQIHAVVDAFGEVRDTMQTHSNYTFPTHEYLRSIVSSGPNDYGRQALDALEEGGNLTQGAQNLIAAVNASDEPLYVQIWGGSNTLATALWYVNRTRSAEDLAAFGSKLRVYSISDQDDTGIWARRNFPNIRWIASRHGWNMYPLAAWTGISSTAVDVGGPDNSLVAQSWLTQHIQIGLLGKHYPDVEFIMEGDSPSMLYTIPNGLGNPEHPDWGSWGGRYTSDPLYGTAQFGDALDYVVGKNNQTFSTNHATIWRWRDAYQYEFASRMQWTLAPYNVSKGNTTHPPVVVVNDSCGTKALELDVQAGQNITLDASASYSPDNTRLNFTWFHYREPTTTQSSLAEVPQINFTYPSGSGDRVIQLQVPYPESGSCVKAENVTDVGNTANLRRCQTYHVVVAVKAAADANPMTRYKRVLLHVQPYDNSTSARN